ncbi:MAG: hypothetical protein JW969_01990 [Spirochaetales bacterium]|nr:hypothetical protein [Spirochaetales bacterium]
MKYNNGSASVIVVSFVTFVTVILVGLVFIVEASLSLEAVVQKKFDARKEMIKKAEEVVQEILKDDTPVNDSPFDEIWNYINDNPDVKLRDAGSLLNPNLLDIPMIKHINTRFGGSLFIEEGDKIIDDFKTYRNDEGFQLDLATGFRDYLQKDAVEEFCTPYTYFNINTTYEYALQEFYKVRTGEEAAAEVFHTNVIQKMLYEKKILDTQDKMINYLEDKGVNTSTIDELLPLLTAEPAMNVHFVPDAILYAILSYPDFKITAPITKADAIINEVKTNEDGLTKSTLQSIIGPLTEYPAPRVYQYFGVTTWFWEITIEQGDYKLRWIIARKPEDSTTTETEFRLVEEDFE